MRGEQGAGNTSRRSAHDRHCGLKSAPLPLSARSAGFIPEDRAREARRRRYLTPSCSRSSLRTQVRAPTRPPRDRGRDGALAPPLHPNRPSGSMRGEARRSLASASQSVRFAYSTERSEAPHRPLLRDCLPAAFRFIIRPCLTMAKVPFHQNARHYFSANIVRVEVSVSRIRSNSRTSR